MNIEMLKKRITNLNYKIDDFSEEHIEALIDLHNDNIDVTDAMLNPKIDGLFFNIYANLVIAEENQIKKECMIKVLSHIQSNMGFRHAKLLLDAIGNQSQLKQLDLIFSNDIFSANRKMYLAELMINEQPYQHLFNPAFSDEEVKQERIKYEVSINKKLNTLHIPELRGYGGELVEPPC